MGLESPLDPAVVRHVVDRSRTAGNEAFRHKRYKDAVQLYSQAIAGDAGDAALFGNRSAAHLALGLYEAALLDAREAVALRPGWPKAHYRLGCALLALSRWQEAAEALGRAAELEPVSGEVGAKLAEARKRADAETAARAAQAACERRGITAQLRAARRADAQLAQLNQFKQSMVGPDWELEDLEWRPTYLPAMRLKPLQAKTAQSDPKRHVLAGYLAALADLAHPKCALRTLEDMPRLQAYQHGITSALASQPADAHALVLGTGGGVLPLLAAQAGVSSVTAVERSRMMYRMAKQVLESNTGRGPDPGAAERVALLDRRLQSIGVRGEPLPPDAQAALAALAQAAAELDRLRLAEGAGHPQQAAPALPSAQDVEREVAAMLPARASLLVVDWLDHTVLGQGLLPALDYAADRLLAPGAAVVPAAVCVWGMLLELRVGDVSGFDLSALNSYWWHPGAGGERLDLARLPHRRLSAPFPVHRLDLQARADARLAANRDQKASGSGSGSGSGGSSCCGGKVPNSGSNETAETTQNSAGQPCTEQQWELDTTVEVPVTADGHWNAVVFWFELQPGTQSDPAVTSWATGSAAIPERNGRDAPTAETGSPPAAESWGQAVQYVDNQAVVRGGQVRLQVRHDAGQYVFTSTPPQCRPRHALVPRWHFDMVLDTQRNDAYDAAIRRAVRFKRDAGCARLLALDVGAGTGLLSMMAARAGADEVYAAEISQHMCDVGEEAVISNGFLNRIVMLDRDARRLDVLRKPDGTPPDLPRRADLLVYEVFDSGCIGEGVLHILAAAQAKLLAPDAAMVPLSARVFCQPIQMRTGSVLGWDCAQANRWRWRPDYEGVELGKCRDQWVALAPAVEVFYFDLTNAAAHMAPAEAVLDLAFGADGVFNAVAMWFDLQLDEESSLSTSPYADKGLTWQQAVQWVPEVEVRDGQHLNLTARHDTYSISYAHALPADPAPEASPSSGASAGSNTEEASSSGGVHSGAAALAGDSAGSDSCEPRRTAVPLMDPTWQAAYERLQGLNSQLVKACVQNPLEYRAAAQAALAMATRPHDLGVDAQQAAEFCMKMMG